MPELGAGFGATVAAATQGARAQQQADRQEYLKYLDDRGKAETSGQAFDELKELTDRGLMDPDEQVLDSLEITAQYQQAFDRTVGAGGTLGINIGPANISVNGQVQQRDTSSANLSVTARYVTRDRADFVKRLMDGMRNVPDWLVKQQDKTQDNGQKTTTPAGK